MSRRSQNTCLFPAWRRDFCILRWVAAAVAMSELCSLLIGCCIGHSWRSADCSCTRRRKKFIAGPRGKRTRVNLPLARQLLMPFSDSDRTTIISDYIVLSLFFSFFLPRCIKDPNTYSLLYQYLLFDSYIVCTAPIKCHRKPFKEFYTNNIYISSL